MPSVSCPTEGFLFIMCEIKDHRKLIAYPLGGVKVGIDPLGQMTRHNTRFPNGTPLFEQMPTLQPRRIMLLPDERKSLRIAQPHTTLKGKMIRVAAPAVLTATGLLGCNQPIPKNDPIESHSYSVESDGQLQSASSQSEIYIPQYPEASLDELLDSNNADIVTIPAKNIDDEIKNEIDKLIKSGNIKDTPNLQLVLGTAVAAASADGPLPVGDVAAVILTAYTAWQVIQASNQENPVIYAIEMNDHSKESRGAELAQFIWDEVSAAFLSPDPNDNRRRKALCGLSKLANGISETIIYALEIDSINKPNVKRAIALVFGKNHDGKIVHITSLYVRDYDKFLKKQPNIMENILNIDCSDGGPLGPGAVFGSP